MAWKYWVLTCAIAFAVIQGAQADAADLKITVPRHSHLTPVQRLNREGVEAIRKHDAKKAEALFYKAYLLDPDDPFTLNNLGYISELQGQVDRAQRFYTLAAQEPTDAVIARASSPAVQGRSIHEALNVQNAELPVDHDNVEAVRLLSQGRAPEVDLLLQAALKSDPQNVITLNNMGVAKEMEGESQEALKYYDAAAGLHSETAAVVTLDRKWRGRPVSEVATRNASNLRSRLENQKSVDLRVAELNLRGVSAVNRNDLTSAVQDFRNAYALDANNAFALNNIGYLSEIEGDPETAQSFYERAQAAPGAKAAVGLASLSSEKGLKLFELASASDVKVQAALLAQRDALREHPEPILLRRRDNSLVQEPAAPAPHTSPSQTDTPQPQQ